MTVRQQEKSINPGAPFVANTSTQSRNKQLLRMSKPWMVTLETRSSLYVTLSLFWGENLTASPQEANGVVIRPCLADVDTLSIINHLTHPVTSHQTFRKWGHTSLKETSRSLTHVVQPAVRVPAHLTYCGGKKTKFKTQVLFEAKSSHSF